MIRTVVASTLVATVGLVACGTLETTPVAGCEEGMAMVRPSEQRCSVW